MSASRRSNKVSVSDATSTEKAPKGKSSHGGSKDANSSKGKLPQTKQSTLTSLANRNQQKLQTLTPEERELFESVKKTSQKGADTHTEHQAPKSVNKEYRTPSPKPIVTGKKNGKTSAQSKTDPPPQLKPSKDAEEISEDSDEESEEEEEAVISSTESPKNEKIEEKMIIEEEQENEEQDSSNLKPIELAVPDPISGFIRDTQGRLTPRSDLFSFEGKSAGKSARKEDVSAFDERSKSNQKKLGSNSRKLPTILDSVLEDDDYEIQIDITEIDEEEDVSQEIRGREFRDNSNRKKHASGEKRMLKGIGSTGGYWGNILAEIGRQDSADEPLKKRIDNKENDIVIQKRGGEDSEDHEVVRVIVPEGVEHDDEESQLVKNRRRNNKEHIEDEREEDQERKIRETMTSLRKSDLLNESIFAEQIEIMEENKDLFENEDIMEDQDRRPADSSRMEEEEEHTQRKRNIKEMLDMLVGDGSNLDENQNSKQSSQFTFDNRSRMQVERSNKDDVLIEEEPMTGEAKNKEINAEIAKKRNNAEAKAKASENEESDEALERIGDLEEIEDLRSPGHTDNSIEEIEKEETNKKKHQTGSVASEELDNLQDLADIEEIRPAQEDVNKGEIDREIEQIEQEDNLGNIEDSEAEQSSIPASPESEPREQPKKRTGTLIQETLEQNIEDSEENEQDDEKLFESNQDVQKLLSQKKLQETKAKNVIEVEQSSEGHNNEEEEIEIEEESVEEEQEQDDEEEEVESVTPVTGKPDDAQDIVVPSIMHHKTKEVDLERVIEEEGEDSIFLGDSQKLNEDSSSQFQYVHEKEDERQAPRKGKPEREEDQEWDVDEEEEQQAEEEEVQEEELVIEEEEIEPVATNSRNQPNLRESSVRKEYTAYEDWRLIEAMKWYIQRKGEDGMQSKKTWENIKDPSTGKRLLNNERTGESMRNRIRRTLNVLEEEDKEYIRNYVQNHSEEEARTQYCRFEKDKWTGQKKFKGIFAQLNYNPQTLTKKKNDLERSTSRISTSRNLSNRRNAGRVQDAFEKGELSDDIETIEESQSVIDTKVQRLVDFPGEFTNPKMMTHSVIINRVQREPHANPEKIYVFEDEGQKTSFKVTQYNPTIKKITRENRQEETLPPDTESLPKSSVQKDSGKSSKKRKEYEDKELTGRHNCELKKVKQNDYFEQKCLMVSDAFKARRHSELDVTPRDDLMIFLDLEEGFRQFVQDKDRLHEEPENDWLETLSLLATRYKLPLKKIGALFNQVSCDLDDLELYLKTKRPALLWDATEDSDLLTGNEIGIRYLRMAKGEDRMEKRRRYLMNS